MTDTGNFDAAPIDPTHGSSGPGGPLFPIASGTESGSYGQPGTVQPPDDIEPETRHGAAGIVHPPWCDTATCGVRIDAGTPFGAHRSKKVTLPGRIEVRLSIWALHGTPAAIAFDIIDETAAEGLRDVEVPAFVAEVPLTLGELLGESGVLLDIEEARTAARVMLELARQAEATP